MLNRIARRVVRGVVLRAAGRARASARTKSKFTCTAVRAQKVPRTNRFVYNFAYNSVPTACPYNILIYSTPDGVINLNTRGKRGSKLRGRVRGGGGGAAATQWPNGRDLTAGRTGGGPACLRSQMVMRYY